MNVAALVAAGLGVALAVGAIAFDDRRLTWLAIVVLGAALIVRMIVRRRRKDSLPD
jgi:Flp pilus assembly protein TadB